PHLPTSLYILSLHDALPIFFGVYQFYFWCQRHPAAATRQFSMPLDEWIPYRPRWAWIYSFLDYPAIITLNWTVTSPRHFNHLAIDRKSTRLNSSHVAISYAV